MFRGTKLADNYIDESGTGTYYVQYAYGWGYVDNHPNNDARSNFKIEWAVDDEGNSVELPGIHFVKVYTAVNQYCGWLGETSTEVMGAQDLHLLPDGSNTSVGSVKDSPILSLLQNPVREHLVIASEEVCSAQVYNQQGKMVRQFALVSGTNRISCGELPSGLYLLRSGNEIIKFLKR